MYDSMGVAILGVIFGVLAAIIYSLRMLVIMERRIARMDSHIEIIAKKIAREEFKIEKQEAAILQALKADKVSRVAKSKAPTKKK